MSKHTPMIRYIGYNPETEECTYAAPNMWNGGTPPLKTARLLDTAPELLETLRDVIPYVSKWLHTMETQPGCACDRALMAARAIISKATGE